VWEFIIETWLFISFFAFLTAGTIKGTTGLGLPVAAVGLMAQFIDPKLAITLMVFPIVFANTWQFYRAKNHLLIIKQYWRLATAVFASILIATTFTANIPSTALTAFLGIVVIVFASTNLLFKPPSIPDHANRPMQIIFGVAAGIMGGLTAVFSPPITMYLMGRGVEKDQFVSVSGFVFLVGCVPLTLGFLNNGLLTPTISIQSMAMIIPTLMGFSLGELIRKRINPEDFKKVVLIFFFVMGANLIRKSFM
jgi:uncharacterized membrane protein YfcA